MGDLPPGGRVSKGHEGSLTWGLGNRSPGAGGPWGMGEPLTWGPCSYVGPLTWGPGTLWGPLP